MEQLKQKEKEIEDLNGRILKLENDKRAIADVLTEAKKNLEGLSHNAIVSQVDEINKARLDLEAKQRELERKDKEYWLLTEENKELKERLLRIEIDQQSSIVVKSDPSLPDQSIDLRQLEERYRHLQTHNGRLTVQLQQQQQQYEEKSKQQKELITELSQKIEVSSFIYITSDTCICTLKVYPI